MTGTTDAAERRNAAHRGEATASEATPGGAVPGDEIPGDEIPGDAIPGDALTGDTLPGDALTSPLHLPHAAAECPRCFTELQRDRHWWLARPAGSRLVGLVVSRPGMPSVVEQRDDLTRFGVPIEGFRHPAPETLEIWPDRLTRFFDTLKEGDVLVVANVHALGATLEEETRAVAALHSRGVVVKVLGHGGRHLFDAGR